MSIPLPPPNRLEDAWHFVRKNLFDPDTGLIYDHVIRNRKEEFPTPEEIRRGYPNPCGYVLHFTGCGKSRTDSGNGARGACG